MQAPTFSAAIGPDRSPVLEHQLDLVRSAIALLAGGGARRVTLVNLALAEDDLRALESLARASGTLLRATRHIGLDITVEATG